MRHNEPESSQVISARPEALAEKALLPTHEHLDDLLDEALKDTFPASDPVSIAVTSNEVDSFAAIKRRSPSPEHHDPAKST